jgi:hypothetical protein
MQRDNDSWSHLVRAGLALILTAILPFVLYFGPAGTGGFIQAYQDALAAVVAFYFGASTGSGE